MVLKASSRGLGVEIKVIMRMLTIPTLLVASMGVPYVVSNSPEWAESWSHAANQSIDGRFQTSTSPYAAPANLTARMTASPSGPGSVLYPTAMPLGGTPGFSLADVFNLDVSKQWVYGSWPRKSTGLAEIDSYGVRVPLVTGTQLHDLAGSLTYFFGNDGRVKRISFHGRTGDTTQLVTLLTQRYGLQRQTTVVAGQQLFQIRRKGQVFSELRTKPASVLWASTPHDSFSVDLELQRADATKPLPSRHAVATAQPAPQQPPAQPPNSARSREAIPTAEAEQDPREKWRAFFPRSRVPKSQVNNLGKRDHLW